MKWIRPQDVVWLLLFSALAAVSTSPTRPEIFLVLSLGFFQVLEPRITYFSTQTGTLLSLFIKLLLCYLLIGFTGGISSTYYLILMLPVVAAATTQGVRGTGVVVIIAVAEYLSFLAFVDWSRQELTRDALGELGLRVIFLPVIGFLTQQLAQANRIEARNSQAVAEQLQAANESLYAAEAEVRRNDRLAALGQLTAGLAHELRNPLGTMRASAEMLQGSLAAANPVAIELAGFIASEVDRVNSLITRFLEFARPLQLRRQVIDVALLLDAAIQELNQHHPPFQVSVHRNYSPDIPKLSLDVEWMQRVFYNLLLNAVQASPSGGSVSVKIRASDDFVEVSFIDRGTGIKPEHLDHIFNPFFTTRNSGVGLGLAIVSKLVDEHGGNIRAESLPEQGSVFRVFLPIGTIEKSP